MIFRKRVKSSTQNPLHLIAVTTMFADFHFRIDAEDTLVGEWQHEFVLKANGDKDEFWKSREATFSKVQN